MQKKSTLLVNPKDGTVDRLMSNGSIRKNVGNFSSAGYKQVWLNGTMALVHRLVWESAHGEIPKDVQVDHINGQRDDNRIENLRLVTRSENNQNRHNPRRNSRSGVKGVTWDKQAGKWSAKIFCNGKRRDLGRFKTIDEASAAYNAGARLFHTHNPSARQN